MTRTTLTRRALLRLAAASGLAGAAPGLAASTRKPAADFRLEARPATAPLVGAGEPATPVWAFNGTVPGPELRVPVGRPVRIVVENGLAQTTTVHWHGIRLPNAMDGVPGLTQPAIEPGERFTYAFTPPDAGTFWYHPHVRSSEQIGRGLAGVLIVEEATPPAVDRDVTWVLDDWRLTRAAAIGEDFGNRHDASHAGRVGNVVTVNGRVGDGFAVSSGERIRLRLVNVANARSFALSFEGHRPLVVALDGQPVEPHEPDGGLVVLGAAMRADLLLDCTGAPGTRTRVVDRFYPRLNYLLTELHYLSTPGPAAGPGAGRAGTDVVALPSNSLPEPNLRDAEVHAIVLAGGAMGGLRGAELDGAWTDIGALARKRLVWAMNGVVRRSDRFDSPPILTARRGSSHRIVLRNETAFPHPMHLHGHHFRVTRRGSAAAPRRPWQDTVLVMPREEVEIAFRADNPGDWLFHCHVLEHMAAGMTGVVRVLEGRA